ncbi:conjugal transfer protein TraB [Streptomyces sp. BH097]|uniref:conjugal transfer protein TraB n=1 Tax=unclassified Streptomyces TaxID=2593676 RepID=UPI003BB65E2F
MSDLVPRQTAGSAPGDGDNSYPAVQAKLEVLIQLLDDGAVELESLHRSMKKNAARCLRVETDIENADFDDEFIELTSHVNTALGGAVSQGKVLRQDAEEVAEELRQARQTHAKDYGPLDAVRSGRRHRTPKPGVFAR